MTSSGSTPYAFALYCWMSSTSAFERDSVTVVESSMIETDHVIDGAEVGKDVVGSIEGTNVGA